MTRGDLIWPMKVVIEQIDTEATANTDPDGAGPLTSGYDPVFDEPEIVPEAEVSPGLAPEGAPRGTLATAYKPEITLEAQIEIDDFNVLRQFSTGNVPSVELRCVFHFRELETQGLIDANGHPEIRNNDRLLRILDPKDESLITRFIPPIYAVRVDDRSFGLSGLDRNLLVVTFSSRDEGVPIGT